jgi:hypothetical protein
MKKPMKKMPFEKSPMDKKADSKMMKAMPKKPGKINKSKGGM